MKKLYTPIHNLSWRKKFRFLIMVALFMTTVFRSYGQVLVNFNPRSSTATPTETIYNIKGDFTMLGNTNLTLVNYSDTANNNSDMRYVDVDSDASTWNSSSANLTFSTENGAIPECSKIIYAGLYWTGRAGASETFSVTKGNDTKVFNKKRC
ncbi:hypothetical protein ACFQ0I_10170 [Mariniflexile aquimaris]|uniref:Uncharacterized protein n=1 Tax=Mariniflexile aquimaris TaxID=881009 RepID=A0ABW3BSV2_9FLAO